MATRYFRSNDRKDKNDDNDQHNRSSSSHRAEHPLLTNNKQDKLDGNSFFGQHAGIISQLLTAFESGNVAPGLSLNSVYLIASRIHSINFSVEV